MNCRDGRTRSFTFKAAKKSVDFDDMVLAASYKHEVLVVRGVAHRLHEKAQDGSLGHLNLQHRGEALPGEASQEEERPVPTLALGSAGISKTTGFSSALMRWSVPEKRRLLILLPSASSLRQLTVLAR